jgi:hypothetical protein
MQAILELDLKYSYTSIGVGFQFGAPRYLEDVRLPLQIYGFSTNITEGLLMVPVQYVNCLGTWETFLGTSSHRLTDQTHERWKCIAQGDGEQPKNLL